jgi:hypothetical protein
MKPLLFVIAALFCALIAPPNAFGWSRAGHMVSAVIAFDELAARHDPVIEKIAAIIDRHPDRGAFVVAEGQAGGEERALA